MRKKATSKQEIQPGILDLFPTAMSLYQKKNGGVHIDVFSHIVDKYG